jgi:translocation and assembly module TamA
VRHVEIRFSGPAASDPAARSRFERVRGGWLLRRGEPFRQEDWEESKRRAARELAGWRYAAAEIVSSRAIVDPAAHEVVLEVEIASGPPHRFGTRSVTGTKRYDDALVENLAPLRAGEDYDREKVVLYQRRLLESGYFASVQAEIDTQGGDPAGAPLRVSVIEAPKHHVESGVSYNTDVGPRFELRYTNGDMLDTAWRSKSSLNLDQKIQSLQFDVDSPPRPGGIWNSLFARIKQQDIQGEVTREQAVGVSHNYGASASPASLITSAHTEEQRVGGAVADSRYAIYFGAKKLFRHTDAFVSPREGYAVSLEAGGTPQRLSSRSFLRGVANASLFIPFGRNIDLLLRGQAGAVLSDTREGIPSAFLFRTGGDQTVRGYSFESLGVNQNGAVVGGRRLLVLSGESTFWVTPSWGVAAFADAGDAWDSGVRPVLAKGYGLGARFRTPIGPIRADLAYGQRTHDVRVHLSVGYTF